MALSRFRWNLPLKSWSEGVLKLMILVPFPARGELLLSCLLVDTPVLRRTAFWCFDFTLANPISCSVAFVRCVLWLECRVCRVVGPIRFLIHDHMRLQVGFHKKHTYVHMYSIAFSTNCIASLLVMVSWALLNLGSVG